MDSASRGLSQAYVDVGVFQETKVTKGIYTQELSIYRVVASEAPSEHSGGVSMFYRAAEHFYVETLRLHGANVVIFQIVAGG